MGFWTALQIGDVVIMCAQCILLFRQWGTVGNQLACKPQGRDCLWDEIPTHYSMVSSHCNLIREMEGDA